MPKIQKDTSAVISTALTRLVLLFLIAAVPTLPMLTSLFLKSQHPTLLETSFYPILINLYIALLPAFAAVFALLRLLGNVRGGNVFCPQSVACLRMISWCCFAETVIFAVFGIFFVLAFFLSFAALFMGLILRVVKNVLEYGTALKNENDLTV